MGRINNIRKKDFGESPVEAGPTNTAWDLTSILCINSSLSLFILLNLKPWKSRCIRHTINS